jgi:omega-amidase
MKVTLIQTDLIWQDKVANLQRFDALISAHDETTDVIILPEMFTTGFSMQTEMLAEATESATLAQMKVWAAAKNAAICGSIIVEEEGNYYNRLLWVQPDGKFFYYDKKHLFGLAEEDKFYKAGETKLIVEWRGWKICPLICYDIRFPVWSRNVENYDLLIYIANFPQRRIQAWKTLLLARAIENQCFTIGVNRIGTDGNGAYYTGDSGIVDFEGNVLFQSSEEEIISTFSLDLSQQQNFRQKLPFLKDADIFTII